ncbi:MAG: hypothetical protein A2075_01545 [Geobacteraceae bacterium GWC2_58_44]|nr:MAG: hypothetical protein A2075_01545 [Geobacteraceae bacterium GWC2_58_44]HBG08307.1 response regulator [Geobacter sp.]
METRSEPAPSISLMIVEDDENSREILVAILPRKFPDVTVYSAENGRTGLELFKTHTPDIVITDINMPELGGVQMAEKIRAIKPDIKLIVITADTGKVTLEHAVGKGFQVNHVILKPIDIAGLFAVIEECISATALHKSRVTTSP